MLNVNENDKRLIVNCMINLEDVVCDALICVSVVWPALIEIKVVDELIEAPVSIKLYDFISSLLCNATGASSSCYWALNADDTGIYVNPNI